MFFVVFLSPDSPSGFEFSFLLFILLLMFIVPPSVSTRKTNVLVLFTAGASTLRHGWVLRALLHCATIYTLVGRTRRRLVPTFRVSRMARAASVTTDPNPSHASGRFSWRITTPLKLLLWSICIFLMLNKGWTDVDTSKCVASVPLEMVRGHTRVSRRPQLVVSLC